MAAPQLGKGRAYVEIHILSVSQVRVPTRAKRYALIEDCLKKQIVPRGVKLGQGIQIVPILGSHVPACRCKGRLQIADSIGYRAIDDYQVSS